MHELNDLTEGRLFEFMVNKFRQLSEQINGVKESMEWVKHSDCGYHDDSRYFYPGGFTAFANVMEM